MRPRKELAKKEGRKKSKKQKHVGGKERSARKKKHEGLSTSSRWVKKAPELKAHTRKMTRKKKGSDQSDKEDENLIRKRRGTQGIQSKTTTQKSNKGNIHGAKRKRHQSSKEET